MFAQKRRHIVLVEAHKMNARNTLWHVVALLAATAFITAVSHKYLLPQPSSWAAPHALPTAVIEGYSVSGILLGMSMDEVEQVAGLPNRKHEHSWVYGTPHSGFSAIDTTVCFHGGIVASVIGPNLELGGQAIVKSGDSSQVPLKKLGTRHSLRESEWLHGGTGWCFEHQNFVVVIYIKRGLCEGVAIESHPPLLRKTVK
jgi:hypothetical protein